MKDENGRRSLFELFDEEKENLKGIDSENFLFKIQNFITRIYSNLKLWTQRIIKIIIILSVLYSLKRLINRFWCGSFCISSY